MSGAANENVFERRFTNGQRFDLSGFDGFGHVSIEACIFRAMTIIIPSPTRERYQTNIRPARLAAKFLGDLVTAQVRHAEVDNCYLRTECLREC